MNDLRGHRTPSFGRQLAQRVSWLHQNIGIYCVNTGYMKETNLS